MQEILVELVPFQIWMECDCGGIYKFASKIVSMPTNPPSFPHICDKCKQAQNLLFQYPRMGFKPKEVVDAEKEAEAAKSKE